MSGRTSAIFVIVLGSVLLLGALKWGIIGGGGVGADRDENPRLFWFLFLFFAFWLFIGIVVILLSALRSGGLG